MKKVLLTGAGGHFTAALAVIEELREGKWEIYWAGGSSAFETARGVPLWELEILPKLGIVYYPIHTGKIQRGKIFQTAWSLLRLPIGFLQSLFLLARLRPSVVLSFGGYVSVPIAWSAWLLRIPIVVHEQTTASGLANRIVSRIANRVAVSSASSIKDFPQDKIVLTGNPVRKDIFKIAENRGLKMESRKMKAEDRGWTIYVTGGSRGSQTINKAVFEVLDELLELGEVYHQTGLLDYQKALRAVGPLGPEAENYIPQANFFPWEAEGIYKKADLVISRAGANTVSELEVLGIPAILIPIPWAEKNEQKKNARILKEAGTGLVITQEELTGKTLLSGVKEILENPRSFEKRGKDTLLAKKDAAGKIVKLLDEVA